MPTDQTIIDGFVAKGIAPADIKPENVQTSNDWKSLGRSVRKGERGLKIITFTETPRQPMTRFLFHISQTETNAARQARAAPRRRYRYLAKSYTPVW